MSHIVSIKTQLKDATGVQAACRRLGLPEPVQGKAELFSGSEAGLLVNLPNWVYAAVVDLTSGEVKYDNYKGRWGDPRELDRFLQAYAIEKARIEARKAGHTVTEQQLADGSVKLTVQVAGGVA
ncbi:MAG: DUF1257 domain-containing protein [Planctomycetes bacterium]|nr:DUF1257 domain-containing protein [Planctomycetota bacterium]